VKNSLLWQDVVSLVGWRAVSISLALVVVLGLGTVTAKSAQAQTYKESVLYSFTGADGKPEPDLILDAKGNLYGTTRQGGASNDGVVFKVSSKGKFAVLYSFTGADGAKPEPHLILDAKGNLYGTTSQGGASNVGVVFKLTP